jgi:sigma-B regulation protein RsbU (phosphoserine phosphatase)
VLAVPIVVNSTSIGAMIVSGKRAEGDFASGDRISLAALAGYLGIAIKSAQLIKEAQDADALRREFDFARKIQQSLLPKQLPVIATLEIAARCIAATEVGGDLFTFLQTGPDEWAFGVADVAGHGLGAAFILASLRSILRSECRRGAVLEDSITATNDILCEDTQESELFATLLMATYSDTTRTLRSVNAGHPPGFIWKAASRTLELLDRGGMAAGLFKGEEYECNEMTLQPGDTLALYTDGIIESRNGSGELYGTERLRACLALHAASQSAEVILQRILEDIATFHNGVSQNDDVTIVIVKAR